MGNVIIEGVEYAPVAESDKIHIGDVVLLHGRNWPVMTVLNEPKNDGALCVWFQEDKHMLQGTFPVEALEKVPTL